MLVEQLFQLVSCNLPESMWSNLFNTPNHLTSFLRLFTDSFHIQSNIVTLIQHPKVCQKLTDNIYNLNTVKNIPTPKIEQPVSLELEKPRPKSPEKEKEISSLLNSKRKPKISSINDRLKVARMNNKSSETETEKKIEENIEKNEDDKPKGVSFRLGKYNSKNKEENNVPLGQIENDYNGKLLFII